MSRKNWARGLVLLKLEPEAFEQMLHVALVRIMQIAYDMNTVTYFLNSSLS
jgi:hypothetical protein